jgi:regulator of sirC expression with transglutaminase-like and TPR domain
LLEYQKASRLDPGYPLPHRAMGAIYAALGKPELSATAYDTYLNLEPRGPDADAVRALLKRYRQR